MNPTLAIYGIQDIGDPVCEYIHDHNLVVMEGGKVSRYLELERYTRVKHDAKMHQHICNLLELAGLSERKLDLVFVDSYFGRSFISANGKIRFEAPLYREKLSAHLEKGYCWWMGRKVEAYALSHEIAHIFSNVPFFGKFKPNSLLVHFDGGASISNFSAWLYRDRGMECIEHHWDMRYVSSLFDENALNYHILGSNRKEHNSLPGKYMGFAAFGNYRPEIDLWLRANSYFKNIWNNKELFFREAEKRFGWKEKIFSTEDPFLQDIAATVQHIFTEEMLRKLEQLQNRVHADYFYHSGGCALNISTNQAIIESDLFKQVFIPPCTNDSGLALGAATFMEMQKGNDIRAHSPYLNNWGIEEEYSETYERDEELLMQVATLLLQRKIIGVANGYGECGPRSLGNRSILSLADSSQLALKVSMQCKRREWYRPVAPIMLEQNVKKITGMKSIPLISQYMLYNFYVKPEYKNQIEGVVHSDGTSRIQTIFDRKQNSFMFDLLQYLDERFKILALINTSFNGPSEPIVHTQADAHSSAKKMGLDAVVINHRLYETDACDEAINSLKSS
jgi:carbamoyltransferase